MQEQAVRRAQQTAKAAHSLSAEALGRNEFETLIRKKAYLADALGVPVEIFSANAGEGGPHGQEPPSGAGEACDIYRMRPTRLFFLNEERRSWRKKIRIDKF